MLEFTSVAAELFCTQYSTQLSPPRMFEYVGVMLIIGLTDKLTLKLATPL